MKAEYERVGRTIKNLTTNENKTYQHVNEAKRASAKIQRDAGGLGCGILRTKNK